MSEPVKIHAVIYSWPAVHANAFAIARQLAAHVHKVSVVACTDTPLAPEPDLDVVLLDNSAYFGRQFEKTIEVFDGEVLLQIAADTATDSWATVAGQCAARFQNNPKVAIWTPDIDGTTWPNSRVFLYRTEDPNLIGIVQTDCIVWAMSRPIVDFLKTLDYSRTPLGWGIDWAAIAHAYANNLRVLRDLSVKIHHRIGGSGYDRAEADRQKNHFLSALCDDDKIQLQLMSGVIDGLDRMAAEASARAAAEPAASIPDIAPSPGATAGAVHRPASQAQAEQIFAAQLESLGISRILDIGGAEGQFAMRLRELGYGGSIFSVEPRPASYAGLVANAAEDSRWLPLLRQGVAARAGYADGLSDSEPAAGVDERIYRNRLRDLLRSEMASEIQALMIDATLDDELPLNAYGAALKTARLIFLKQRNAATAAELDAHLSGKLGFSRLYTSSDEPKSQAEPHLSIYARPADRPRKPANPHAFRVGAVVTSIGGAIRRQRSDGVDIGEGWRADCIKSWMNLASRVVSVSEMQPPQESITWLTTASKPSIAEMLRRIEDQTSDHAVLVNADIVLTAAFADTIPTVDPEAVYYGRRHEVHHDVDQPESLKSRGYYPQGFDYYLLPPAFVRTVNAENLLPDTFLIGEPWWDYLLPVLAFALGFPTKKFGVNYLLGLHYSHEERYSPEQFYVNSDRFIECLKSLRARKACHAEPLLAQLLEPQPTRMLHLTRITNIICYGLP